VKVWDTARGKCLWTLKGEFHRVLFNVLFSPDGRRLAIVSDKAVQVWNAADGQYLLTCNANFDGVAFSPDGRRLAGVSMGGAVRVWDTVTGKELLLLQQDAKKDNLVDLVFSPDGRDLIGAWPNGTVEFLNVARGQQFLTIQGHTKAAWDVAFSPDGRRLASTSWGEKRVKVWDAARGNCLLTLKGEFDRVIFSPDGRRLAGASSKETAQIWDAATGKVLLTLNASNRKRSVPSVPGGGRFCAVAFSPDGRRLLGSFPLSSVAWRATVWNSTSGKKLLTFWDREEPNAMGFSPGGRRLAVGPEGGKLTVWEVARGKELLSLPHATDNFFGTPPEVTVCAVAFSPDSRRLATAHGSTLVVWDTAAGKELVTFEGHTGKVSGLAFSPGGRRLASICDDGTVKVWHTVTGKCLLTLQGGGRAVAFSPDGRRLAAAGEKMVKVWDAGPTAR
jgi:WD40 repeat protein